MSRALRLLLLGWAVNMKMLSQSAFDGFLGVMWPLLFATLAFFMYGHGKSGASLLYAAFGASVMGVWSSTSVAASSAIQRQRRHGLLELSVAAPAPFALVMLPVTIAMSTIGIYSMASTLLWGRFLFHIHLHLVHPLLFCVAVPATVLAIGMLGFLLSVTVVRYRTAWALGNMFEYPVWLICGFLVPLSLFPHWVRWISWVLAPTWGVSAIRHAALGGPALRDAGLCLGIGLVYATAGVLLTETVLRSARRSASLALTS
jgi:ABC-2 type transport system permease protein